MTGVDGRALTGGAGGEPRAERPLRHKVGHYASFDDAFLGLLWGLPIDGCTLEAAAIYLRLRASGGVDPAGAEGKAAWLAARAWRVRGLRFVPGGRVPAGHAREAALALAEDTRALLLACLDKVVELCAAPGAATLDSARLALHVLAPLAERFGMVHLQRELEDLAFKVADRAAYDETARLVAQRQAQRDAFLDWARRELGALAEQEGIEVQLSSRAKHLWSIHKKLHDKGPGASLHDVFGLRLVTRDVASCYALLGALHEVFSPVPGRIKDYIAQPKANGYQSLHTTVLMGPASTPVEIQLRTEAMHESAERGATAHWIYKNPQHHRAEADRWVYAFTPGGEAVRLPRGATPLDFAYAVHSDLGRQFSGAIVDGRMTRGDAPLETGQVVRILSSPRARATEGQLERVRTSHARNRIRHALGAR